MLWPIKVLAVAVMLSMAGWVPRLEAQGPSFDVASIKPSQGQEAGTRVAAQPGGRFIMTNAPVSAIVLVAYELQDYFQVDGLPEWTRKELFDVEAQAPADVPISFPGQHTALPRMLQTLLADRMKLAAHVEKRSVPMFALVTARADGTLGPNLTRSALDCTIAPTAAGAGQTSSLPPNASSCGNRATLDSFYGKGIPLDRVIRLIIAPRVGRPVVDRTGLSGTFDITLRFRPLDSPLRAAGGPPTPQADPDLPPIETALQEQLGLKLQPIREAADVLVIDRIERPTLN